MIEKNERYMLSLDYYRAYYNDSNVIFKMSGKIDVRAETDRGLGNSVLKAPSHPALRGLQKPHVVYLQIPQEIQFHLSFAFERLTTSTFRAEKR